MYLCTFVCAERLNISVKLVLQVYQVYYIFSFFLSFFMDLKQNGVAVCPLVHLLCMQSNTTIMFLRSITTEIQDLSLKCFGTKCSLQPPTFKSTTMWCHKVQALLYEDDDDLTNLILIATSGSLEIRSVLWLGKEITNLFSFADQIYLVLSPRVLVPVWQVLGFCRFSGICWSTQNLAPLSETCNPLEEREKIRMSGHNIYRPKHRFGLLNDDELNLDSENL